jgi:hypothetical protein
MWEKLKERYNLTDYQIALLRYLLFTSVFLKCDVSITFYYIESKSISSVFAFIYANFKVFPPVIFIFFNFIHYITNFYN